MILIAALQVHADQATMELVEKVDGVSKRGKTAVVLPPAHELPRNGLTKMLQSLYVSCLFRIGMKYLLLRRETMNSQRYAMAISWCRQFLHRIGRLLHHRWTSTFSNSSKRT